MPRPKKTASPANTALSPEGEAPTAAQVQAKPGDVPLTETPEFKAAVAAAAAEQAVALEKRILDRIAALRAAENDAAVTPGAPASADPSFAQALAVAIGELGSQGVGKQQIISPAILAERAKAKTRMVDLIIEARHNGTAPVYGLTGKVHLADQLLEPIYIDSATKRQKQTEIDYFGVPNHFMQPLNDVAKAIHAEFLASVGSSVHTSADDSRLMSVTARGTVIRGGSHATQRIVDLENTMGQPANAEGLRIRHDDASANVSEIAVLGTLAPKARSIGSPLRTG